MFLLNGDLADISVVPYVKVKEFCAEQLVNEILSENSSGGLYFLESETLKGTRLVP